MSVMGKLKNILFTEEEETEEIPVIKERVVEEIKQPSVEQEITRFKNINYNDDKKTETIQKSEEIPIPEVKEEKHVVVEDNSPFQSFDEEEFDRIAAINKTRLIERDRRLREEKEKSKEVQRREVKEVVKEEPKFVPSPVISPVYGILDKNYTKDDILPRASSEGTLPKIMDVDMVRKKAFGTLESIEKNLTEDLENIKITTFDDEVDDENDVVITNDEIESVEEVTKPLPKLEVEKEIPPIEAEEPKENFKEDIKDIIKDEKKEDEEIENDLFELIDSMYQDEEGEK